MRKNWGEISAHREGSTEMPRNEEAIETRVRSHDGTEIAYWTTGLGRPLVLVHGALADHNRWRPLLPYLEPHATVHAVDRRGRGASADAAEYRVEREFEDVAAVVDVVANTSGSKVDLYGHSFGGFCAFGAATLTANVRRLVLYEGWPLVDPRMLALPPEVERRLEVLVAEGQAEAVVETFVRDVLMAPDADLSALRSQPSWPTRVAAAHTLTREIRAAVDGASFDPEQAARITVPTLLLIGEDSTDPSKADVETVAAALPNARIGVLAGQQHMADVLAPEVIAEHLIAFLRDGRQ